MAGMIIGAIIILAGVKLFIGGAKDFFGDKK